MKQEFEKIILKKRSVWCHIILTYFTLGIWLIIYFRCKKKKIHSEEIKSNQLKIEEEEKLKERQKQIILKEEENKIKEQKFLDEHKIIETKIVGVTQGKIQEYLLKLEHSCEANILIRPDLNNKYSDNAIEVIAILTTYNKYDESSERHYKIGYLSEQLANEFYQKGYIEKEETSSIRALHYEVTGGTYDKPTRGCNITLAIKKK